MPLTHNPIPCTLNQFITTTLLTLLVTATTFAGDMVYELQLRHAIGRHNLAPMTIVLQSKDGKLHQGFAIAPHVYPEPSYDFDFDDLTLDANRIHGKIKAAWRTGVYNQHPERPQLHATNHFTIDVNFADTTGTGKATGTLTVPNPGRSPRVTEVPETIIEAVRRPAQTYPTDVQFEFPVYYPSQAKGFGWLNLRFTTHKGRANNGFALYRTNRVKSSPVDIKATFDGQTLAARWTSDLAGTQTTYEVKGTAIDRYVTYQVKMTANGSTWKCDGHGRLNLSPRRLPERAPATTRNQSLHH